MDTNPSSAREETEARDPPIAQRPADRHAAGEQLGEIRAQDRGPSIFWCVWGGRGGVSGACGPAGFRTTWEMFNVPESEAHPRRPDQNWGWGWGGACF